MGVEQTYRNSIRKLKGFCFKTYLQLNGCKVGSGLKCYAFPKIRAVPKGNITIGNNATFGYGCTLEIGTEGKLILGNNVLLADNILLSTISEIRIGDWAAIAENVSIRGSFHKMKKHEPYRLQGNVSEPIVIGEDTGIGAGCIVLMGVTVPKGVFIGSNSTVLKDTIMVPYGIYAGLPLKLLKIRG